MPPTSSTDGPAGGLEHGSHRLVLGFFHSGSINCRAFRITAGFSSRMSQTVLSHGPLVECHIPPKPPATANDATELLHDEVLVCLPVAQHLDNFISIRLDQVNIGVLHELEYAIDGNPS